MATHRLPELDGVLSPEDIAQTAEYLADMQEASGAIPWFRGGHLDVWDHVECAMALATAGHTQAAMRAYGWLADIQLPDGSWPAKLRHGHAVTGLREANHAAYIAVGVWHQLVLTEDENWAHRLFPTVQAALDFVLDLRTPRGEVRWARDADGTAGDHALLTACSSIHHALRCGVHLADRLGAARPDWELAAAQLGHLISEHEDIFADRSRFSMDWYYPILGGAVRLGAQTRIDERWDQFVVPGLGIRCVSDQPWVTGAETCELVIALAALGLREHGTQLLAAMQHLRDPADGAYWTGYQFVERRNWPVERSSWTAASVILAADALTQTTPGARVFTDVAAEPGAVDPDRCGCGVLVR
ncbi:prenyltransferase [Lipingzhangella sp. LS1_29]|uniref:Prenyltransferase n=1 Tax=Lipingzhangella rawalii TaxID=2055835 RepID=A0ABU2HAK8_9ACTN|nr:prenyltransferase [Lipingzhangella rawalii]MDS1272042.1 prenyltransferase [Lipingzhangella rawalii]